MAKYSTGEVSGARASMHRFAIFCMAGVRTIIFDDRDGLVRLLELSFAISPARDRRSLSAGPSADKRNPDRKRGVGGPEICLGMGSYRSRSVLVRLEIGGDLNLPNGMLLMGALGDGKPRLRRIEATYRKTTKQDSRVRGLLAGDSKLEMTACVSLASSKSKRCSWNRPLLYRARIADHHKRGPRLWSRYRVGNTLTARSVEGRVP